MTEKEKDLSVQDWIQLLSPQNIALRSGTLMGFITAVIAIAAEVPLEQVVLRSLIAVILFTGIGWATGYVLTSIDFEAVLAPSPIEEIAIFEEQEEELGEDILDASALEQVDSHKKEKQGMQTAVVEALKDTVNKKEQTPRALPAGGTEVVMPEKANKRSRKLVVG